MLNLSSPADMRLLMLVGLLAIATWHDLRTRRIPNPLVLTGALAALALHQLEQWQLGAGLIAGLLQGLGGFFAGLLLLLPFYLLRVMGAGDVKLMAMVGAFLGPLPVIGATLLTMLAGGIFAVLVALSNGQLRQVLGNVLQILSGARMERMPGSETGNKQGPATSGQFPYAAAIGTGTLMQLALAGTPSWQLFS